MVLRSCPGHSALPKAIVLAVMLLGTAVASARDASPPPDLTGIVKDEAWAKILGKALFWDTVAGDGTACAGCHFSPGTDSRMPAHQGLGLLARRASSSELGAIINEVPVRTAKSVRGVIDVCSRQARLQSLEVSDTRPASQAPGPTLGSSDPSCQGSSAAQLARKLLVHQPLGLRTLHPGDSLFGNAGPHGNLISRMGRGLDRTYQWLIQQAFDEKLWNAPGFYVVTSEGRLIPSSGGFTQVEQNFALFWGISIMLYESTLSMDASRFHTCRSSIGIDLANCQDPLTPFWHRVPESEGST